MKLGQNELLFILNKFHCDWVKIVDFKIKAYFKIYKLYFRTVLMYTIIYHHSSVWAPCLRVMGSPWDPHRSSPLPLGGGEFAFQNPGVSFKLFVCTTTGGSSYSAQKKGL